MRWRVPCAVTCDALTVVVAFGSLAVLGLVRRRCVPSPVVPLLRTWLVSFQRLGQSAVVLAFLVSGQLVQARVAVV